jgi:hypothetical protein
MLFARLLLSPMPHARVSRLDISEALKVPGVKAIITADDIPTPGDSMTDGGGVVKANPLGERALTNEPKYEGEPILAVAAVDELTACDRAHPHRVRAAAVCRRSARHAATRWPESAGGRQRLDSPGRRRRPERHPDDRRDQVDGAGLRRLRPGQGADRQGAGHLVVR